MTVTYLFVAEFTKSKVKTTPTDAPTIDIADLNAPTAALLVAGGSPTELTHMPGVYLYSYVAAESVKPLALFRTADTTIDLQDVPSYPLPFDAAGKLLATENGGGSVAFSDIVDDGTNPLDNVKVWATTDVDGANVYASTQTASDGSFTLHLDSGTATYYVWFERGGFNFENPIVITYNVDSGEFEEA